MPTVGKLISMLAGVLAQIADKVEEKILEGEYLILHTGPYITAVEVDNEKFEIWTEGPDKNTRIVAMGKGSDRIETHLCFVKPMEVRVQLNGAAEDEYLIRRNALLMEKVSIMSELEKLDEVYNKSMDKKRVTLDSVVGVDPGDDILWDRELVEAD